MDIRKYKTYEMLDKAFSNDLNDFVEFCGWAFQLPFRLLFDILKDCLYGIGFVFLYVVRNDSTKKLIHFLLVSPYVAILLSTIFLTLLIFQPYLMPAYWSVVFKTVLLFSVYLLSLSRLKELDRRYALFEKSLEERTLEYARKQLTLGLEDGANPEKKRLELMAAEADLRLKLTEAELNEAKAEALRNQGSSEGLDIQLKALELKLKQKDLEIKQEGQEIRKIELNMKRADVESRNDLEFNLSAEEKERLNVNQIDDNLLYAVRRLQDWFEFFHKGSIRLELMSIPDGVSGNEWKIVFRTNLNESQFSPNPATDPQHRQNLENQGVFITMYQRKKEKVLISINKKSKRQGSIDPTKLNNSSS